MKPQPLLALDVALARLLEHATPLGETETVSVFDAAGRVLAEDVVSALHVPPQDNSSMDGYAVRCSDVADAGVELRVTQRIAAGSTGQTLESGCAARIFTGAPIPPGADAVVMQEDCQALGDEADPRVRLHAVPEPGQWIRRAGEDVARGACVLAKGQRLSAAALGLAASIGRAELKVVRRPLVVLFSTGDELVMPGEVAPEAMRPGAIYNSNRFFLRALLQGLGCDVDDRGIVPDNREATLAALRDAAATADLVLTSGGVSVGEEDHIKPAVTTLGQLDLWQIAMKPGKPFAYGRIQREPGRHPAFAHFIGLPGNPVSSFVTFVALVRPFLLRTLGVADTEVPALTLPAHFDGPRADRRREFLRARRNALGGVELFANQSSGVLTSVVWADGLIDNPAGTRIARGDPVRFIPLSELMA